MNITDNLSPEIVFNAFTNNFSSVSTLELLEGVLSLYDTASTAACSGIGISDTELYFIQRIGYMMKEICRSVNDDPKDNETYLNHRLNFIKSGIAAKYEEIRRIENEIEGLKQQSNSTN